MNKYLEKVAAHEKKRTEGRVAAEVGGGFLAAKMMKDNTQRVLGYHTLYHGTTNENAASIKKNGFDPSLGGTGNAKLREKYVKNSKGKVHFTKNKFVSNMYAGGIGESMKNHSGNFEKAMNEVFKNRITGKGTVLKTRVPHSMYKKMDVDWDSSPRHKRDNHPEAEKFKDKASTTSRKIGSEFIAGGKGSKGAARFATRNNLRRYLSTADGKARFKSGLGSMAVGAGLGAAAIYSNYKTNGILGKLKRD